MTFELEVAGRVRTVTVEPVGAADPRGGRFRVSVGVDPAEPAASAISHVHDVEVRLTDLGLMLLFTGDRRVVDAAVTEQPGGDVLVQLARTEVVVAAGRRARRPDVAAGAGASGEERLAAPMPGRVLRVLARPGDDVAARQPIVVVEAMKMENEISAARPGRVREVTVAEGESVAAGRTLAVIDSVR